MQVLLREKLEQDYVQLVSFKTETLSLKQTIAAMAPIIDQKQFKIVDIISATSRSMKQLSAYRLREKQRAEAIGIISNGSTTIEVVDYEEKTRDHVIHDPVICITGVDARVVGKDIVANVVRTLVGSVLDVKMAILKDLRGITNNADSVVKDILDEARLALLRRLKPNV